MTRVVRSPQKLDSKIVVFADESYSYVVTINGESFDFVFMTIIRNWVLEKLRAPDSEF